jgi:glycerophosphoryl diester phosphodiesterase
MKVIETFTAGKTGDETLNEDKIALTPDFIAVIDGVTSKTAATIMGKKGGRFAAETVAAAISDLQPDIDARDAVAFLSARLRDAVREATGASAGESPACCLAVYSRARRQVWRLCDVSVMIDGQAHLARMAVDEVVSAARALMIGLLLQKGETVESLRADDLSRAAILPFLQGQHLLANHPAAGNAYGVLNGAAVPEKFINIIDARDAREIALATDGYPSIRPTLAESEAYLARVLREDPLLYKLHPSTKGWQAGNLSFDDRAYIRFAP